MNCSINQGHNSISSATVPLGLMPLSHATVSGKKSLGNPTQPNKRKVNIVFGLFIFLSGIVGSSPAYSSSGLWVDAFRQYVSSDSSALDSCAGCHSFNELSQLRISNQYVNRNAASFRLDLDQIDASEKGFAYLKVDGNPTPVERILNGAVGPSASVNNIVLSSPPADSVTSIEYCLAERENVAVEDWIRNYYCGVFNVLPDEPATIGISNTNVQFTKGETTNFNLIFADEFPDELTQFNWVANSSNLSISAGSSTTNQTDTRFPITASGTIAGDYSITVSVRDRQNQITTKVFSVKVVEPADSAPEISFNPSGGVSIVKAEKLLVTLPLFPDITDPIITIPDIVTKPDIIKPISTDTGPVTVVATITDEDLPSVDIQATSTKNLAFTEVSRVISSGVMKISYSLKSSIVGKASFTVTATDDAGQTTKKSLAVSVVEDTNIPTLFTVEPSNTITIAENESIDVKILVQHPNLSGLSYSIAQHGGAVAKAVLSKIAVDKSSAILRITGLQVGTTEVWVSIDHTNSNIQTAVISITVTPAEPEPVNAPPVVSLSSGQNKIDLNLRGSTVLPVSVSDEDSSTVSVSAESKNTNIVLAEINGLGELVLTGQNTGTATVELSAIDNVNNVSAVYAITVTVTDNNQAPEAKSDTFVFTFSNTSQALDVLSNDTDPEGQNLVIILSSDNSELGGILSAQRGEVIYTPPANWTKQDVFYYQAEDTSGLRSDKVSVTVNASDRDGDGIFDNSDNCKDLANPDQSNMDDDKLGDVCDSDPFGNGIDNQEFASGKNLVDSTCLTCHLTGVSGAPVFGDNGVWSALLAQPGGLEALVQSVTNGKGAMRAFGTDYSAKELTQAVRYLSGLENLPEPEFLDIDGDKIEDTKDNCPVVSNNSQLDTNDDGIGDACEPLADGDNDGYPFALDDDDTNAKRLLSSSFATNPGVFSSDNDLAIGDLATHVARSSNFIAAGIEIGESEFINAANALSPGVTSSVETGLTSSMGIFNFKVRNASAFTHDVIIRLPENLPLRPIFRIYDSSTGMWSDLDSNGNDTVSSAQLIGNSCPAAISPNYQANLAPGLRCVKLSLSDGGSNDADGQSNGTINFIGRIVSSPFPDPSGNKENPDPPVVSVTPSKGGGMLQTHWLLGLLLWSLIAFLARVGVWNRVTQNRAKL